jgi:3-carboxy-cis,cis-muconate cycloisomerase
MREVFSEEGRLNSLLRAEEALARAEAEYGLAPPELGDAISGVQARDFDLDALGRKTALAGIPTIPFVAELQKLLPEALRGHVHRGATTQDILDTGLVLQIRDAFGLIETDLAMLLERLKMLALRYERTPCVGRTLGQHAAPVTFGFKAAVWMIGVANVAAALPAIKQQVLTASLGGPVGTLASLGDKGPSVAAAFARHLGLRMPPIAWHTIRTPIAQTGSWIMLLLGALGKIAGDVILLSSTDVGEVSEPHVEGRGGSSAMPHKRNPVSSIVITAAQTAAKGHAVTLFDAMIAPQERPPGLWQAEWLTVPPLFGLASGALREAVALTTGLEIHPARMAENLQRTNGLFFAEAAAARLGERLGRTGAHALVEEAANEVRRSGEPLQSVLAREPFLAQTLGVPMERAFDLTLAVEAAAFWVRSAVKFVDGIQAAMETKP